MVYNIKMEQMREAYLPDNGPFNPFFAHGGPLVAPPQMAAAPVPPGLHSLYAACRQVYPNQHNPLQVAAVLKYWLGGPDPLDYISMFANPGDLDQGIPPHWHYVSFGLSDLHGDGRVHEATLPDSPSGFGFELSFRLKREADEASPPTWPAAVMQSLAKYVFQSENILCPGDHVSWHCSLDNSDSEIQHMLMTEDPQLGTVMTPFGSVTFIQIVGVCVAELKAAQQWNGPGLIDAMKGVEGAGGPWLVTDMRRGESIFELDPEIRDAVEDGIATEGSNLSGVTAKCSWTECKEDERGCLELDEDDRSKDEHSSESATEITPILSTGHQDMDDNRSTLSPTSSRSNKVSSRNSRHSSMSCAREDQATATDPTSSRMSYLSDHNEGKEPAELLKTKFLNSVHIKMNLEAGALLPLALRGRLKHGRHFTFKTVAGDLAITLLTEAVSGSYATLEHRFALHGPWLQVLIPSEEVASVLEAFQELSQSSSEPNSLQLPKTFEFADINLSITLLPEELALNT